MNYICLDGEIIPADQPALRADNRAYRYGDGLFETMKMIREKICLDTFHFERFFSGLKLLQFKIPALLTPEKLSQQIAYLCKKNKCAQLARIRLSAFGGNGGIYDDSRSLHYMIESWPVSQSQNELNENGLTIDIYPNARKTCDAFSNLKSANFLPYVMAAQYAKSNRWNDCLVLNMHERIADSTIANVFVISKDKILTPPLSEGCINGVMRRYLLEKLKINECPATIEDILHADEIFLTNATSGIRWVKQMRDKRFDNSQTIQIYDSFIKTIWE